MLEAVAALADNAWTEETKDSARRTLMILKPEVVRHSVRDVNSLHVMMSCEFHKTSQTHLPELDLNSLLWIRSMGRPNCCEETRG